jgi:hypothetical protein
MNWLPWMIAGCLSGASVFQYLAARNMRRLREACERLERITTKSL